MQPFYGRMQMRACVAIGEMRDEELSLQYKLAQTKVRFPTAAGLFVLRSRKTFNINSAYSQTSSVRPVFRLALSTAAIKYLLWKKMSLY